MSSYDYDDGRSDYTSSRYYDERRHQRDPRYAEARDAYSKTVTSRDLVPRAREDSDLSVEEIHRDFPPPTYTKDMYADDRPRSSRDRGYERDYDRRETKKTARGSLSYDEERKRRRMLSNQEKILAAVVGGAIAVGGKELYDRREARSDGHAVHRNALSSAALGAAGALAAYGSADYYNKHASKEDRKTAMAHKGRGDLYSDDDSDRDDARQKKSHKNFLEGALAAAGLGGAVKALTSADDRRSDDGRSHRSSRDHSDSRSRSRGHGQGGSGSGTNKIQKAAMASLIAGATEAFRVAKEPGAWKGEKAKRVLTAAAGAATIDAATDEKRSKMGIAESVIGGLLSNRLVNGSRRNIEEDRYTGRSRSRSRARSDGGNNTAGGVSGLAALATAGLGALGAKKIADNHDERSRSRDRSHRSRSRSVVDSARRGLSKLGIGNDDDDDRRRGSSRSRSRHHHHRRRRRSADSFDDYSPDRRRGGGGSRSRDPSRDRSRDRDRGSGRTKRDNYDDDTRSNRPRRKKGGSASDSESDLGSSSEDEKRAKKIRDGRHRH